MRSVFAKLDRYFCKWRLAVLDDAAGRWVVQPDIAYLKAENAHGRHILMQPARQPHFLLADDITADLLHRQHQRPDGSWKPGRMIVQTSPGNYQVWIHSLRQLSLEEKRYWLKRLHSDPGADPNNRWGRCPGFRNRKAKHRRADGGYPLARLVWIDWKYKADIARAPAKMFDAPTASCPRYRQIYSRVSRADYARPDASATDFAFALALLRRGYPDDVIRQRIIEERIDWENHLGERRLNSYLDKTIKRARRLIICSRQI